jgi:hypothetical protein
MNAHLAYMSKRAYVFNDYVWAGEHYMWPLHQQPPGDPRTPFNAILSGPSDPAPRSISERWFDVVCSPEESCLIVSAAIKSLLADLPGTEVFAAWEMLLRDAPERCVEIVSAPYEVDKMPQVFDLWIWGNSRVLSLWPSCSQSTTSKLLAASPIVCAAVERNTYLFNPRGPRLLTAPRDWAQRTLAIHLRRGDFIQHCRNLAGWGSGFYSWRICREEKARSARCTSSLSNKPQRVHPDIPRSTRGLAVVLNGLYFFLVFFQVLRHRRAFGLSRAPSCTT